MPGLLSANVWLWGLLDNNDPNSQFSLFPWSRAIHIGLDNTFKFGSGLNFLAEHFVYEQSRSAFSRGQGLEFSALSLRYSFGILDSLSGLFYYDWKNRTFYRFINWQRTYDRLSFYLTGFWNPRDFLIYPTRTTENIFRGKGFQVMLVFHH